MRVVHIRKTEGVYGYQYPSAKADNPYPCWELRRSTKILYFQGALHRIGDWPMLYMRFCTVRPIKSQDRILAICACKEYSYWEAQTN